MRAIRREARTYRYFILNRAARSALRREARGLHPPAAGCTSACTRRRALLDRASTTSAPSARRSARRKSPVRRLSG